MKKENRKGNQMIALFFDLKRPQIINFMKEFNEIFTKIEQIMEILLENILLIVKL